MCHGRCTKISLSFEEIDVNNIFMNIKDIDKVELELKLISSDQEVVMSHNMKIVTNAPITMYQGFNKVRLRKQDDVNNVTFNACDILLYAKDGQESELPIEPKISHIAIRGAKS